MGSDRRYLNMSSRKLEAFYGVVKGRRSVRSYTGERVRDDVLCRVFEAARWAPSAHNSQPWRFIVLEDLKVRERLVNAMKSAWIKDLLRDGVPMEKILKLVEEECVDRFMKSPVVILACLTMEDMDKYPDDRRRAAEHAMAVQSVAASIQNLLLAAHWEGLGACWVCAPLFCQEEVRRALCLPKELEPQAIITMGYPAEKPDPPARKRLSEIVLSVTPGGGLSRGEA